MQISAERNPGNVKEWRRDTEIHESRSFQDSIWFGDQKITKNTKKKKSKIEIEKVWKVQTLTRKFKKNITYTCIYIELLVE